MFVILYVIQPSLLAAKSSVESQKGINVVQRRSVENQKGAIAVQSLRQFNNIT